MESKKISDWFNLMHEPERSLALKNRSGHDAEAMRMHHAIDGGFLWDQTDEGFEYWQRVRNYYIGFNPYKKE